MAEVTKINQYEVEVKEMKEVKTTVDKATIVAELKGLKERRDTDLAYWNTQIAEKKAILDEIIRLNIAERV